MEHKFKVGDLVRVKKKVEVSWATEKMGVVVDHEFDAGYWFTRVKHLDDGQVYGWFEDNLEAPPDLT